MKQRYIKRQPKNPEDIEYLIDMGISPKLAEAMNARGICRENFARFFGEDCFHSPFEMKNMREATEVLSYILDEGGAVLICGDYDADGLTAASILSLFFSDNGIENDVIIPTRETGYGLHADAVILAFEKKFYDLVITVDCGISNKVEVETIIDKLGVEVIVTDHHELPEVLPPCICVNPKMGYPFPNLSGSGVAWKVVEALIGREQAAKYSDLAMIGTIGDSMPMEDENRSIVKLGLATRTHKSLKKLEETVKCSEPPTATDISMKISPRINAAGRMGQPDIALNFLLSRDKVSSALDMLIELNEQRKIIQTELIVQADAECDKNEIESNRLVFVYGDDWQHGILGPVAAKYVGKFGYPSIVLAKDKESGTYVGSARSPDNVDIFEIFCGVKDLLVKFGGHKAAVGFSVLQENLLPLKHALAERLNRLDASCFRKQLYYDVDLDQGEVLAEMLSFSQKMEPLLPQNKVVFRVRDCVKTATLFGKDNSHLNLTLGGGLEIKSFSKFAEYAPFVRGADIEALITLEYDEYSKRICGFAEDMHLVNSVCFDEFYKYSFVKNFQPQYVRSISENDVENILRRTSVLAVFDDYATYLQLCETFDFSDFAEDIFFDTAFSEKMVVVSPNPDYGFGKFRNILYFCKSDAARIMPQGTWYYCVEPANAELYEVELNRQICVSVYSRLKNKDRFESLRGMYDKYLAGSMRYESFLAALRVFEQLNFIRIHDKYTVEILSAQRADLTESSIYHYFAK